MTQDFFWSERRIEKLRALWKVGTTASAIAAHLGDGVTRNAVVGKAHRLGLTGRPSPIRRGAGNVQPAQKRARETIKRQWDANLKASAAAREAKLKRAPQPNQRPVQVPPPAAAPKAPPPPARPQRASAGSLRCCAWPIGDPKKPGFHFCGEAPVVQGRPYCEVHAEKAYQRKAAE